MSDPNTERRLAYLERLTAQMAERLRDLERPTEPAPPRSEAPTVVDK